MKFCKDCKWHADDDNCTKQSSSKQVLDPVTGKFNTEVNLMNFWRRYCSAHRKDGILTSYLFGSCGKRARYFEPKTEREVTV